MRDPPRPGNRAGPSPTSTPARAAARWSRTPCPSSRAASPVRSEASRPPTCPSIGWSSSSMRSGSGAPASPSCCRGPAASSPRPVCRRRDLEAPLLEQLSPERRRSIEPIVRQMLAGQQGFQILEVQGRRGRVLYQSIGAEGWSLAVFYPEDELMEGVTRLREIQAAMGLVGLAVLVAGRRPSLAPADRADPGAGRRCSRARLEPRGGDCRSRDRRTSWARSPRLSGTCATRCVVTFTTSR